MSCTTLLIGKKASYDGSTMIARNDDASAGRFTPKKLTVVLPGDQPRHYVSVISHVEIDLPDNPMRYSAVPNALEGEGIWAGAGVNAANVAMTATIHPRYYNFAALKMLLQIQHSYQDQRYLRKKPEQRDYMALFLSAMLYHKNRHHKE